MGFLDKARAAANDLAAKADTALASSGLGGPGTTGGGDADRYFRDLGVLAYLDAIGRPVDPQEHRRVMTALQEMDARGAVRSFALQTSPTPAPASSAPPPPPGAAGAQAPPPPGSDPSSIPPPVEAPVTQRVQQAPEGPSAPPPPPPSWARGDGGS